MAISDESDVGGSGEGEITADYAKTIEVHLTYLTPSNVILSGYGMTFPETVELVETRPDTIDSTYRQ